MKGLLVAVVLLCTVALASALIAPEGYHPVAKCVKITNSDRFNDTAFIILEIGDVENGYRLFVAEQGRCLKLEQPQDRAKLYAVERNYLDYEGLDALEVTPLGQDDYLLTDMHALPASTVINLSEGFVVDSDPLKGLISEYRVLGFGDEGLLVYEARRISTFLDGSPDEVKTFPMPDYMSMRTTFREKVEPAVNVTENATEPVVEPEQDQVNETAVVSKTTDRSFWQAIACFFKGIFGKGC